MEKREGLMKSSAKLLLKVCSLFDLHVQISVDMFHKVLRVVNSDIAVYKYQLLFFALALMYLVR